ncbi:Uncharacterised protein [Paenibacillus macerans]|nr:Uncharacterised protein [Paenibacillus macerans]
MTFVWENTIISLLFIILLVIVIWTAVRSIRKKK